MMALRHIFLTGVATTLLPALALAQVVAVRSIGAQPSCVAGGVVEVRIDASVAQDVARPSGVIVVEKLPPEWTFVSATPPPSSVDSQTGEVRWLFFGADVNGESMDIAYRVTVPALSLATLQGRVLFNASDGAAREERVGGAANCLGAAVCAGDCNADGQVTVDEVVQAVTVAVGAAGTGPGCQAADANRDGQITVDEILTALNHALSGCPR